MYILERRKEKMLKLKSAQADFTNPDVKRVLMNVSEEYSKCQQKIQLIQEINSEMDLIKGQGQLQLSLQDLQGNARLWEMITMVIGSDHGSLNPQGLFGS